MPRQALACIDTWKKYCPDYEFKLWNEDNFDINGNAFCRTAYEQGAWAFVSDYARLAVISQFGGFYFDVDVEILRSIDPLREHRAFVGIEQLDGRVNTGLGFGGEKDNKAINRMLREYDEIIYSDDDKEIMTCPLLNDDAIRSFGYAGVGLGEVPLQIDDVITVYPCEYFDPISMGENSRNLLTSNSYSIHHASYSWGTNLQRVKRIIANQIGLERTHKIKSLFRNVSQ